MVDRSSPDPRLATVAALIAASGAGRQLSNWGFRAPPVGLQVGDAFDIRPRGTYVTIDRVLGFNGNCRVTTARTSNGQQGPLTTPYDLVIERRGVGGRFETFSRRDGLALPAAFRFAEQGVYRITAELRGAIPSAFRGVPKRLTMTVTVSDPALKRDAGLVRVKIALPEGFAGSAMVIRGDRPGVGTSGRGLASQCRQRFAYEATRIDATILHETSHAQQLTDQRERPFGDGLWTLTRISDGSVMREQAGGERFLITASELGNGGYALRLEVPEALQPKGLQAFRIPPAVRQITVLDCGPPQVAAKQGGKGVNCRVGQSGASPFSSREAFESFTAGQAETAAREAEDRARVAELQSRDQSSLTAEERSFLEQETADVRCESDELELAIDPIPLGADQGGQQVNPIADAGKGATVTAADFVTDSGAEPQHQPAPVGLTCPLLESEIARREQQVTKSCGPALALMTKLVLAAPRFARKLANVSKLQREIAVRHAFVGLGADTQLILPRAIAKDLQELAKIERAFRGLIAEAHGKNALVATDQRFNVLLEVSPETARAILPGQTPKDARGAELVNVVTNDNGEQVVQFLRRKFPKRNPDQPTTIGNGLSPAQFEFPSQEISDSAARAAAFAERLALLEDLRARFGELTRQHEAVRRRLEAAADAYDAERLAFNEAVAAAFDELAAMRREHEETRAALQSLFESNALEHCLGRFESQFSGRPLESVSVRDVLNRPNPAAGLPGMNVVMPDIEALRNVVPILAPPPRPKNLKAQFINVPPFDRFFPFEIKRNGTEQLAFDVEAKNLAREIKAAEIAGKSAAVKEILFKILFQVGRVQGTFGAAGQEIAIESQLGTAIESPDELLFQAITGVDVNLENDTDFTAFRDQAVAALRAKPFPELVQDIGNAINPLLALKEGQDLAERAGEAAFARGDIGIATAFAGLLLGDASLFSEEFDPASLEGQSLEQQSALLGAELDALEKDEAALFASPLALLSILGAISDITGAGSFAAGFGKSLDEVVGGLVSGARRDQAAKVIGDSLNQAGDGATAQLRLNGLREQLDNLKAQGLIGADEANAISKQIDDLLAEIPDTSKAREELAELRDPVPEAPPETPVQNLGQQSELAEELKRLSQEAGDASFKATDQEVEAAVAGVRQNFIQLAERVLKGEVRVTDEAGEFVKVVDGEELGEGTVVGVGNTARVVKDAGDGTGATKFLDAKFVDSNTAAAEFKRLIDEEGAFGFFPDDEISITEVRSGDINFVKFEDLPTQADVEAFMRERALLELADQLQGTALLDEAGIDHARITGVGTAKQTFFVRDGTAIVEVEIDVPFLRTDAVDTSKAADNLVKSGSFSDDHVFEVIRLIEDSSDKGIIHGDPNPGNVLFRGDSETGDLKAVVLEAGVLGTAENADLARAINLSGFGIADPGELNPLRAAGLSRTPGQNGVLGSTRGSFTAKEIFPEDILEILPDRDLTKEFLKRYDAARAEGPEAVQAFHNNRQQIIEGLKADADQRVAKIDDLEQEIARSGALDQRLPEAQQQIESVSDELDGIARGTDGTDETPVPDQPSTGQSSPDEPSPDEPSTGGTAAGPAPGEIDQVKQKIDSALQDSLGDSAASNRDVEGGLIPFLRPRVPIDDEPEESEDQRSGWLPRVPEGVRHAFWLLEELIGIRAARAQGGAIEAFILSRVGNPPRFVAQKVIEYKEITKRLVRELEEKRRNGLCGPGGGAGEQQKLFPPGLALLVPPAMQAIQVEIRRPGGVAQETPLVGGGEQIIIKTELDSVDIIVGFNPFDRTSVESLESLQGRGFVSEEVIEDPMVLQVLDVVEDMVDSGNIAMAQQMMEDAGVSEEVAQQVVNQMTGMAPPPAPPATPTFFADVLNCSAFGGGNSPFTISRDTSGNVTVTYQAPSVPLGLQTILGPFAQDTVINVMFNVQDPVATAAIPFPQSLTEVVQQAVTLSFSVASSGTSATILMATCGAGVQGVP